MNANASSSPVENKLEIVLLSWIDLEPSPTNPRKIFNGIEELAASIRAMGVLQPLVVRLKEVGYEVVAGERRMRACGLIDVNYPVPCTVRTLSDRDALEIQLVENGEREDVHPLEEADGYAALQAMGATVEEIVGKVGKTKEYVYGRLKLCRLAPEARKAFLAGAIGASSALKIARIPTAAKQDEAMAAILNWSESVRTVHNIANLIESRFTVRLDGAPFPKRDGGLVPDAGSCFACPKRTGNMPELQTQGGKAGTSADVCTDPDCYRQKVDAYWKQLGQQATLPNALFNIDKSADGSWRWNGKWIDLDDIHAFDPDGRTWRELLGDRPPRITYCRFGEMISPLVPTDKAEAALKKAGHSFDRPSGGGGSYQPDPKLAAKRLEREKAEKKRAKTLDGVARAIVEKAEKIKPTVEFWRLLLWLFFRSDDFAVGAVAERRGFESKGWELGIQKLTESEARGLLVELLLAINQVFYPYTLDEDIATEELAHVCRFLGLDLAKLLDVPAKVEATKKPAAPAKVEVKKKPAERKPAKVETKKQPPAPAKVEAKKKPAKS